MGFLWWVENPGIPRNAGKIHKQAEKN